MSTELAVCSMLEKLSLHSAAGSYQYSIDIDKTKADCMKEELWLWIRWFLPPVPFILIIDFQYAILKSPSLINKLGHNHQVFFFDRATSLVDDIETL